MIKVSITLPNNALITFESEEPAVIHEVVRMVLGDLPRDLMLAAPAINGGPASSTPREISNDVPPVPLTDILTAPAVIESTPASISTEPTGPPLPAVEDATLPASAAEVEADIPGSDVHPSGGVAPAATGAAAQEVGPPTLDEQRFIEFCRSVNPMGDMRRVVVAGEGARQFLNQPSVDSESLVRLFQLAAWQLPNNFIQTLRNAARSKFRWMERIPGRSGHYAVTDVGREKARGK